METNKFQVAGKTKVINGSILTPQNAGLRFILSLNSLSGKVDGNPLSTLFDKKWPKVKQEAKGWYANKTGAYKLGAINTIPVQSDVWIIQMLCQENDLKVNLDGLRDCLKGACASAKAEQATVHVSSILTDEIPELKELLTEHLLANGVSVYYYIES